MGGWWVGLGWEGGGRGAEWKFGINEARNNLGELVPLNSIAGVPVPLNSIHCVPQCAN